MDAPYGPCCASRAIFATDSMYKFDAAADPKFVKKISKINYIFSNPKFIKLFTITVYFQGRFLVENKRFSVLKPRDLLLLN